MSTVYILLALLIAAAWISGLNPLDKIDYLKRMDVVRVQSTMPEKHFCFEEKCVCSGTLANCSRNNGTLTFVPKFQERITALDFSFNALQFITDAFFSNVTGLLWLDLSNNCLENISDDSFKLLPNLKAIDLDLNYNLTFHIFKALSRVKTLEHLNASNAAMGPMPHDLFLHHPLPNLQKLRLARNEMIVLNFSVFEPLKQLRSLTLSSNRLSYNVSTHHISTLEYMDLNKNGIWDFLVTCSGNGSYYPALQYLYFSSNQIMRLPTKVCLPQLKVLELGENVFTFFTGAFGVHRYPRLQELYLYNMHRRIDSLPPYTFNNTNLQLLSFQENDVDFTTQGVSPDVLAGCPNLKTLRLSNNRFLGISDKKLRRLLAPLPHLTQLILGNDLLLEITEHTFRHLYSLQVLNLFSNGLTSIPNGAFNSLTHLKELILSGNQLSVIGPKTFSPHLHHNLDRLDLGENPFHCSCELLWFQKWLLSNPKLFSNPRIRYKHLMCKNLPGVKVADFSINEQTCMISKEASVNVIISFAMVIGALTVTVVLYRYRWHIRLMLYESFRGRQEQRLSRLQNQHFLFDVFVSYASEDLPWVRRHLVPGLETYLGLRLCLHERDFIPGKNIVDNIADCVDASKKIVMLFSADFARSPWCQFELAYCLSHVMDNDDDLIVVCLHDIPSRELTTAMRAVFKTTTYIQWCEEEDAVKSFWGRLQVALQEVMPRNVQ